MKQEHWSGEQYGDFPWHKVKWRTTVVIVLSTFIIGICALRGALAFVMDFAHR